MPTNAISPFVSSSARAALIAAISIALPVGVRAQTPTDPSTVFCAPGRAPTCFGVVIETTPTTDAGTAANVRIRNLQGTTETIAGLPSTRAAWARVYGVQLRKKGAGAFGGNDELSAIDVVAGPGAFASGGVSYTWSLDPIDAGDGTVGGYELFTDLSDGGAEIVGCSAPPNLINPFLRTCGTTTTTSEVNLKFFTGGTWSAGDVVATLLFEDPLGEFACTLAPTSSADANAPFECVALTGTVSGGNNACIAPPSGLVGWWGGEDTPRDLAGTSNGTLLNGATYAGGKVGRAFLVDGVDDGILIGQRSALDVGTGAGMTIALWFYPTGDGSSDVFGSGPLVEFANGVHLWQEPGLNGLWANVLSTTGVQNGLPSSGAAQNAWNHLAVTYDKQSGVGTMYLNGTVVQQASFGVMTPQTSTLLYLGMRPAGSFSLPGSFNGRLDEVQIFNRALSAGEVQNIVTADSYGLCKLPTNTAPNANAGGPYWAVRDQSVMLSASASSDPDGDAITAYNWSFGDGIVASTPTPTFSHTYANLGSYVVSLTVTDANGAISTVQTTTVTVEKPLPTITAGEDYACALRANGTAQCWGANPYGAQGVPSNVAFTQLVGGFATTCGLRTDGTITCSGSDGSGQNLAPPGQYKEVSSGQYHGCALAADGTLSCWGSNAGGAKDLPAGQYAQVSAGWRSTCAIKRDGTLACVGIVTGGGIAVPAGTFLQVSAAEHHSCAIKTDHSIVCWGGNDNGEVGGTPVAASMTYSHPGNYRDVRTAWYHTCAIRSDNTIECWGANPDGRATPPSGAFVQIALAAVNGCALRATGTITCWGPNTRGQTTVPLEFLIQQAISFTSTPPSLATYNGSYSVSASGGGSGNAVTFSSLTPAVCGVSGSTATFVGVGTCTVAADQAGNSSYAPAPQRTQSFAVAKADQTVTFTSTPANTFYHGFSQVTAVSSVTGLPITFTSQTPGVCTLDGQTVRYNAVGTCTIQAAQAGNTLYNAATATQTATITKSPQNVSFTSLFLYGVMDTKSTVSAVASSGLPVDNYIGAPSAVCSVSGTTVTFSNIGLCTVKATQNGNENYLPGIGEMSFPVIYPFTGFSSPIANAPAVNTEKAGTSVKIKFKLGGNRGLGVVATAKQGEIPVASCGTTAVPTSTVPATAGTALKYDAAADQYIYTWDTGAARAGTCVVFIMTLADGTVHKAHFNFTK